jgi:uncharacterized protein (DUF2147 family)
MLPKNPNIPEVIMKKAAILVGACAVLLLASWVYAAQPDPLLGRWWNQEKDAQIEIYTCDGKYCGRIVWLKEPNYPADDPKGMAGKPKVDRENPDPSLRTRPTLGLNLLSGFTRTGNDKWENGTIYNPREGKTYKCKITQESPDRLKVRGFVGISLIGKTQIWTRVK